jgi:hypothetical protein
MPVTAKFKLHGHDIEAPVVNPGDWFGKTWAIENAVGYSVGYRIVEADSEQSALDTLCDDEEHGRVIRIDIASNGDDWGFPAEKGQVVGDEKAKEGDWIDLQGCLTNKEPCFGEPTLLGNAGEPCDLTDIAIHRITDCRYFDSDDATLSAEGVKPEEWDERHKRWRVREFVGGEQNKWEVRKDDFRTKKEATNWVLGLDSSVLDLWFVDVEEYDIEPVKASSDTVPSA